ncbi:MAP kinase kinase kinase [Aureococcus anophagefferens]|nr:MAP kinase kinase kinase [Aureococcus anophagefferens]
MRTGTLEQSLQAIQGSVPWMAPEVIKQSGHGRGADVWSVGATVIEMATAKHPWPKFSNNLTALFQIATSTEPPPCPDSLSPAAKAFIDRCLQIDPKDRATAKELLADDFVMNSP